MTDSTDRTRVEAPGRRLRRGPVIVTAVVAVLVVDVLAAIFFPQGGFPDIASSINANLEQIAPYTVINLAPGTIPNQAFVITAHPSITSSLLTMWIIMAFIVALAIALTRGLRLVPGRAQNFIEFAIEAARNFATEIGGAQAARYVSLFGTLFIFILLSNWTDLLLFGQKSDVIRTPTSDINITIGLALVTFVTFNVEGIRTMGARRYLGKFFSLAGFRRSPFDGFIDLYVGALEFLLEFFKPVTLSVRLFGNIYGGGIMLGVMTALLLAILPMPFLLLEGFIGVVQALIFSLLTLMYILTALETHEEEAHTAPTFAAEPTGNLAAPAGH